MDGGAQAGGGGLVFAGVRVSVGEDEKVLETNGGDGCTAVWMRFMLLSCAFPNG